MNLLSRAVVLALLTVLAGPISASAAPAWTWPVEPPYAVARSFDKPEQNWLPGHRGVDLTAREQAPVFAAGSGQIMFAGDVGGKPVVSVQHPDGLRTTYEPVTATVSAGDQVEAGQAIGVLVAGHPGCESAACLHWGLRRGDDYLDPLRLLAPRKVRLKPL